MLVLSLALFAFLVSMAAAIVTDLSTMTIPNRLVGVVVVAYACLALASDASLSLIGLHVLTGLFVLLLTFGAFALGWMGGGDAKLIAATALWFGPTLALWDYLFFASLLGGALTLTIILARACLRPTTGNTSVDRLLDPAAGVPYGVALGAAGILVALRLPAMQSVLGLI
ncbi:A24 family peptidase [Aureimonas ureilytica]|uniref:A24 family peptidase n=1 Tax=Aureimonas ureilytica TaxID=401562 RepID=UPI00036547E4|nr:prepilin peptidase [Aureimonas ureilytica]